MLKGFTAAMFAAVACAAPSTGRNVKAPSKVMEGLLGNESPKQYAAELQWYVDAVSSGKISIGLTHPNVKIDETIETFT